MRLNGAGKQERIRFYGIDAPESGQPFGRASTEHVKKVIGDAGFQVQVTEMDKDRFWQFLRTVMQDLPVLLFLLRVFIILRDEVGRLARENSRLNDKISKSDI